MRIKVMILEPDKKPIIKYIKNDISKFKELLGEQISSLSIPSLEENNINLYVTENISTKSKKAGLLITENNTISGAYKKAILTGFVLNCDKVLNTNLSELQINILYNEIFSEKTYLNNETIAINI